MAFSLLIGIPSGILAAVRVGRFWDRAGKVFCYEKEGLNVGVSGIISHFPEQDITATLLSNMEDGVWDPAWKIHEMVVESHMTPCYLS